jgi:hypothetical protein
MRFLSRTLICPSFSSVCPSSRRPGTSRRGFVKQSEEAENKAGTGALRHGKRNKNGIS